ncbi:MAG: lipocalin family protein [Cytophagales bacterium]|nr:lipocalin family protein [Cytophagales bacterium]
MAGTVVAAALLLGSCDELLDEDELADELTDSLGVVGTWKEVNFCSQCNEDAQECEDTPADQPITITFKADGTFESEEVYYDEELDTLLTETTAGTYKLVGTKLTFTANGEDTENEIQFVLNQMIAKSTTTDTVCLEEEIIIEEVIAIEEPAIKGERKASGDEDCSEVVCNFKQTFKKK